MKAVVENVKDSISVTCLLDIKERNNFGFSVKRDE
jgi:hypothetical protein